MPPLPSQASIPRSTAVKLPRCSHWMLLLTGKVVTCLSTGQVWASDLSRQVCHNHPQIFWQKHLESCTLTDYFLFCSKNFLRNCTKNDDPAWWPSYDMKQARVLINQWSAGTWSETADVLITSPVVFGDFPTDQKTREDCDFLLANGSLQKQCLEIGTLSLTRIMSYNTEKESAKILLSSLLILPTVPLKKRISTCN